MSFILKLVRMLLLLALATGASAGAYAHDCGMMGHEAGAPAAFHDAGSSPSVQRVLRPLSQAADCCGQTLPRDSHEVDASSAPAMPLGCVHYCCLMPPAIAMQAGLAELPPAAPLLAQSPVAAPPGVRLVAIFRPPCVA